MIAPSFEQKLSSPVLLKVRTSAWQRHCQRGEQARRRDKQNFQTTFPIYILRLVVNTIVVDNDQITLKHLILISNVYLRRCHSTCKMRT